MGLLVGIKYCVKICYSTGSLCDGTRSSFPPQHLAYPAKGYILFYILLWQHPYEGIAVQDGRIGLKLAVHETESA